MSATAPHDWSTFFLGELCHFIGGNGFREELQGKDSGEYPFIKVSDMELPGNKLQIINSNNWIDQVILKREGFKAFPKNSVVFAKVGAALLLNRRRILTRDTCIDNNMIAAIPFGIEYKYLYYVLSSIDFADFVQSGAVPSINQNQLFNIEINLPPKPEQSKIAEVLSTVDKAIEQTEEMIAKQQRIKTGLMQDLLTRGIDEDGNLRSEETHEFKDSPLGRIPVEWEVLTLGFAVSRTKGSVQTGPFGSQLHAEDYKDSGIPIITVEHLCDGKISHKNLPLVGADDYKRLINSTMSLLTE